jgi:HEAT repeat protein
MNPNIWSDELHADEAAVRRRAAAVLGTVGEVAALDALLAQFKREPDEPTKTTIQWAGRRLRPLQEAGYTTRTAMLAYLHLDTPDVQDANEQAVIDRLTFHNQSTVLQEKRGKLLGNTLGSAFMFAPSVLSSSTNASKALVEADALAAASSGVGRGKPTIARLGSEDIAPFIQRLRATSDAESRKSIALDLAHTHNHPAALPVLAKLCMDDPVESVRDAAERAARHIYYHIVYWHEIEHGTLAAELAQREQAARSDTSVQTPAPTTAARDDAAEALRRAEEERGKRRKR